MRNLFVTLLILVMPIFCFAQNQRIIEGKIINKNTNEPLAYANVYSDNGNGTISNIDGLFSLQTDSLDKMVNISFIGYETITFPINEIPNVIKLQSSSIELSEIIIRPVNVKELISQFIKKEKNYNSKKIQPSTFFYRQTTFTGDVCNEIIETFLKGTSTVSIGKLELQTGRYAALKGDSMHHYVCQENFFNNVRITPVHVKKPKKNMVIVPFQKDFDKYYNVSVRVLFNSKGAKLYEMSFMPKDKIKSPIVEGIVTINPENLILKKYEGEIRNNYLLANDDEVKLKNNSLEFLILYENKDGISYVKTVSLNSSFVVELPIKSFHVEVNGLAFNLNDSIIVNKTNSRKLRFKNSLLKEIAKTGYDPIFWENNPIIKRTPLEDESILIFEKSNLFGTLRR